MHPSSIVAENLFGDIYTERFKEILDVRLAIKHREFDKAKKMMGGILAKYLSDETMADALAGALKIAINSVYGLTFAGFENSFRDPRNKDNIVAKRGALFMVNLERVIKSKGFTGKIDKELEAKIDKFDDSPTSATANEINIELVNKGLYGDCHLSKQVLEYFIGVFGDVAGDVSLFSCPTGGLYLVGGLSVALEPLIADTKIFMKHYLNKDNFQFLLETFPVYLVKNGNIGMLGAAECARRLLLEEK